MSLNINYNALTESDLLQELEWVGYTLRWTTDDKLELFRCGQKWKYSPGEFFESVGQAHRYVFVP